MFETLEERAELLISIKQKALQLLNLEIKESSKVFYNKNSFRIKRLAFQALKKDNEFYCVKIDTSSFKTQDLVKISKLNSNLYYIDKKKSLIYTMDEDFRNWCNLSTGHINAIRLA